MVLVEHLTFRLTTDALNSWSAPTASPALLQVTSTSLNQLIIPPRGSKVVLKKMHGFYVSTLQPAASDRAFKVWLTKTNLSVEPNVNRRREIAWVHGDIHNIEGTPTNTFKAGGAIQIEVDFEGRHNTIKNPQKPATVAYGWGFVHQASGAAFTYFLDLTISYDLIWDDQPNTKPRTEMRYRTQGLSA